MPDDADLRHAVLAHRDDDWPRLVYADWLDDHGEPGRAEFIRAQVLLAKTPPWEPLAVKARHRQPELLSGEPWRSALPKLGLGELAAWHESWPFRRGFGWCLRIRQLSAFLEIADDLFTMEPIGELVLPAATRDEWEAFAQQPWLANIKALRFTTASGLSEPVRALIASDYASGIESIAFEVSTSPGMGAVVELLMQSRFSSQLKELEFRIGHDRDGEILEELNRAPKLNLEKLTLATLGQTPEAFAQLLKLPNAESLKSLSVQHQPLGNTLASAFEWGLQSRGLQQFMVLAGELTGTSIRGFAERSLERLQSLNFSENIFGDEGLAELCARPEFTKLRSLQLSRCGLEDASVPLLTAAPCWPHLAECDLRGNRITDESVNYWLAAAVPPDLAALLISSRFLSEDSQNRLTQHFGGALVLSSGH